MPNYDDNRRPVVRQVTEIYAPDGKSLLMRVVMDGTSAALEVKAQYVYLPSEAREAVIRALTIPTKQQSSNPLLEFFDSSVQLQLHTEQLDTER